MAYRIKRKERVRKAVRRLIRGQLDQAVKVSRDARRPLEERVHDVRTRIKRSRAVIALVQERAGKPAQRGDRRLRKTGRKLAASRDLAVQARIFHALRTRPGVVLAAGVVERLSAAERRLRRAIDPDALERQLLASARALKQLRRRIPAWPVGHDRRTVADGVTHSYRRARRQLGRVRTRSSPARLHEWRKRVKALYYELELLGRAVPELAASLAPKIERLGDLLGQAHDLDGARATIERRPRWFGPPEMRDVVRSLVEERRMTIEREALALAEHVFAARPRDLRAVIDGAWRRWRAGEGEGEAEIAPA